MVRRQFVCSEFAAVSCRNPRSRLAVKFHHGQLILFCLETSDLSHCLDALTRV